MTPLRLPLGRWLILSAALHLSSCDSSRFEKEGNPSYFKPALYTENSQSNATIDSIAQVINLLPGDSAKCNTIYDIAWKVSESDTIAARTYANYLLWLAEENNYATGLAKGEYLLGRLAIDRNEIESAIAHLETSLAHVNNDPQSAAAMKSHYWLARCYRRTADYQGYNEHLAHLKEIANARGDKEHLSYAYEGFGNLYRYLGDYTQSLSNYKKAILLANETGDLEQKSTALNNMSLVYEYEGNQDEALRVQLENYAVIQKMNKPEYLVLCLSNLSASCLLLNKSEPAREFSKKALILLHALEPGVVDSKDEATAYGQYAWIMEIDGKPDSALYYYRKSLNISAHSQDKKSVAERYGDLGNVYMTINQADSAEKYFRMKFGVMQDIGFKKGQIDVLNALADLEFKAGKYEAAYADSRHSYLLLDSLQSLNNSSHSAEMETWNKIKEQQQQIQLLSHDKEVREVQLQKRDAITYALAAGFILMLTVAFLVFRNYKQKQRANRELEHKVSLRTMELTRKNSDLKNFIYKSSHDLRSPIASIKGLVTIATRDAENKEAVIDHLSKINTVIEKQDSTLTALLKISRLIEGKIEPDTISLGELFDEMIAQQKAEKAADGVVITANVSGDMTISTDRVALTSIVQNLLSNSVKYKRRRGAVSSYVKISATTLNGGVHIEVSDNGEGIPENWKDKIFELFSRGTATAEGSGLGLYIVRNAVDLLNGKLELESTFGIGTTFRIWLPLKVVSSVE